MQPFQLADGVNQERAKQTFIEMFRIMCDDVVKARALCGVKHNPTAHEIQASLKRLIDDEMKWPVYLNDQYQVQVRPVEFGGRDGGWPDMVWLSIRRLDRAAIHDWREFQEIKNLLVGPECEGMEMYPAEARLVDSANQYHLFVFKDPMVRFPFGFNERLVDDTSLTTTEQRPRKVT